MSRAVHQSVTRREDDAAAGPCGGVSKRTRSSFGHAGEEGDRLERYPPTVRERSWSVCVELAVLGATAHLESCDPPRRPSAEAQVAAHMLGR